MKLLICRTMTLCLVALCVIFTAACSASGSDVPSKDSIMVHLEAPEFSNFDEMKDFLSIIIEGGYPTQVNLEDCFDFGELLSDSTQNGISLRGYYYTNDDGIGVYFCEGYSVNYSCGTSISYFGELRSEEHSKELRSASEVYTNVADVFSGSDGNKWIETEKAYVRYTLSDAKITGVYFIFDERSVYINFESPQGVVESSFANELRTDSGLQATLSKIIEILAAGSN